MSRWVASLVAAPNMPDMLTCCVDGAASNSPVPESNGLGLATVRGARVSAMESNSESMSSKPADSSLPKGSPSEGSNAADICSSTRAFSFSATRAAAALRFISSGSSRPRRAMLRWARAMSRI